MGTGEVLRRCLKRGVNEEYRRFFLSKRFSSFEYPGSAGADSALYPPSVMRKFSIIARVDHGKSGFLDRLITGTIRKGHGQPQYLDKLQVGRERGITVKAQTGSRVHSSNNERKKYLLNLIETPAHVDFSYEVCRSLAACQECRTFLSQGHNLRKDTLTEASGLNQIRLSGLGGRGLVARNLHSVRCISTQFALAAKQKSGRQERSETGITTQEDPFDTLTDKIPVQPVTVAEGASYSIAILAGLAVAGAAAYTIFKELIVEPKEYKVYGKALNRVQTDMQIAGRLGSPIHGYGQESQNRSARQRISNRQWFDEDGVEHVEVMFHVRGPGGGGKVFCEMFKDPEDKSWKFTYLIVDVTHPAPKRFLLESYVPEVKVNLSAA